MRISGLVILACFLATSSAVAADDGFGFMGAGVRAGFRLDPDQLLVGGQIDLGDIVSNLRAMPNATIGFGDHETVIGIDPEVHYCFRDNPISPGTWLYAGGGLEFIYANADGPDGSDTSVGVSLTGGISHSLGESQSLMGEVRLVFEDNSFIEIVGSWNFGR